MNNDENLICPIVFKDYLLNKKSIYFDVEGQPFAKQRPRAHKIGNFVSIYTPNETKRYEKKVELAYKKIYGNFLLNGDLTVEVEGYFEPPKAASKSQKMLMLENKIPHTKKPDCDNMAKVCLDALNGIAYNDDAAITNLIVSKQYSDTAKVRITIIENH